ncbi:Glycosyltransferase involved in cell wall bisynthesis [Nonomuraea solani]|uniref:Glycosyltransferase involved in cell wall bisynthesis n=1 Tax=Nonomuraea solani TaxID=1144553 RepID=A0A1H6ER46_9ACTN|nr:glycosyltransferase family 2 protein [Nonomuraea solani]SEH00328.1 Glycosyltransferase involved in cell wall bisynthesis [Nonomuraea solani]
MSATGSDDDAVDVSVVIPVHNCRAYLDRCLTSALVQRVKKEIVVVDDGSTDGSAELLDLYAAYHKASVKVVHIDASGSAGRPRNIGIEHATGRYVFFCDADDHLGPEALERMVAVADGNDSDIVLGKIVGHGRRAPMSMFQHGADRVELGDSTVYNSLSCFKLFRRELLERHRIRFGEGMLVGEDILFTVHAYCHAKGISVVADYDCYHLVSRPDGSSIMQQAGSRDPLSWLAMIREPIRLMTRHIEPGPLRDHLLRRHFRLDVFTQLGAVFLESDDVRRKDIAREVAALCDEWYTPGVHERLNTIDRQRATALDDIDRLVRLARIESATVRRRLTGLRWDGDRLVVTGAARLHGITRDDGLAVVLRSRHDPSAELVVPAERKGSEFTVRVDVAALHSGIWDLRVAVEIEGVVRLGRLGADRDTGITRPQPRLVGGVVSLPYFTRDNGNLSIDMGGHVVAVPGTARLIRTRWSLGHRLLIDGEITVVGTVPAAAAIRRLVWRERRTGCERAERVLALPGGGFAARPAVGRLAPGTWDAYLELDLGGPPARFRIETDAETVAAPRRWWGAALLRSVRPYATSGKGRLSAVVRRLTAETIIKRILQ